MFHRIQLWLGSLREITIHCFNALYLCSSEDIDSTRLTRRGAFFGLRGRHSCRVKVPNPSFRTLLSARLLPRGCQSEPLSVDRAPNLLMPGAKTALSNALLSRSLAGLVVPSPPKIVGSWLYWWNDWYSFASQGALRRYIVRDTVICIAKVEARQVAAVGIY